MDTESLCRVNEGTCELPKPSGADRNCSGRGSHDSVVTHVEPVQGSQGRALLVHTPLCKKLRPTLLSWLNSKTRKVKTKVKTFIQR